MTGAKVHEIYRRLKSKNPTLIHIVNDEETGSVIRAEIHNDSGILWKWPKGSRSRLAVKRSFKSYGRGPRAFTLERPDGSMRALENSMEA